MIGQRVAEILPEKEPWMVSEALIELGATVCKPKQAQCKKCPLMEGCRAYAEGIVDQLPFKSTKVQAVQLFRAVAVISCQDKLLVRRGKEGEIMSDLHEFPYFEATPEGILDHLFAQKLKEEWGLEVQHCHTLPVVKHTFTKYRVSLFPSYFESIGEQEVEGYQWFTRQQLSHLAFSSGHRRVLYNFLRLPMPDLLPSA